MQNDHLHMIVPKWPVPSHVKSLQTTREGGFSAAPFDSLNLAMHVQDNPLAVAKNRQLLAAYLPTEPVWVNQVHGVEAIDAAQSTCLQNADASFSIVKDSISFGSIVDKILVDPSGTALLKGNPSKTIKGSFEAFNDDPPLIRISAFAPGAPPPVTLTPATLPVIKFSAVTF